MEKEAEKEVEKEVDLMDHLIEGTIVKGAMSPIAEKLTNDATDLDLREGEKEKGEGGGRR